MTFFTNPGPNVEQSRGGAYQPINYVVSQTAANDGTATFLFDAVALSNTWTLTINCSTAPDTARWIASSGGTNFGQFKGSNSWGPIQLQGGDRLQVVASGLIPGQAYQMAGYGFCNVVNEPDIVYPTAYADTITTSTEQIYLGSITTSKNGPGNFSLFSVPLSPSYRSIYVAVTGSLGSPSAYTYYGIGNVTNLTYNAIVLPYSSQPNQVVVRIPTLSLQDTSVTIYVSLTTGQSFSNLTFSYGADLANVDTAIYAEGTLDVTVANTSPIPVTISSGGGSTNVTTISGSTTVVSNNVATSPTNTTSTPLYVVGNGSTSTSNAIAIQNTYAGTVQPLQVSAYGGSFNVTPANTSGTPLFVESVSGSTTVVSNTVATTPSNTTSTPLYVATPVVAGTSSAPLEVYQVGGKSTAGVTTTSTTATTMLTAGTSGYAYRLHSITMEYTGTASTTPVQAVLRLVGSGAPFTVDLAVIVYPYQTTIFLGGLLVTYVGGQTIQIINSTTTSTNFTLKYDVVTSPSLP